MKIAKTFRWEMGHRLIDHQGGCRNLHGHSYRMRIEIEGEPADNGMILDFDEMTAAVRPLLQEWDHAFLCDQRDTDLVAFLQARDMKHSVIPFPSTVENLVRLVVQRLEPVFAGHDQVRAFTVRVHETETSSASSRTVLTPHDD